MNLWVPKNAEDFLARWGSFSRWNLLHWVSYWLPSKLAAYQSKYKSDNDVYKNTKPRLTAGGQYSQHTFLNHPWPALSWLESVMKSTLECLYAFFFATIWIHKSLQQERIMRSEWSLRVSDKQPPFEEPVRSLQCLLEPHESNPHYLSTIHTFNSANYWLVECGVVFSCRSVPPSREELPPSTLLPDYTA